MASSIYIYDSLATYEKIYKGVRNDETRESKLVDLFIRNDKLLVVTKTSKHKERPELHKSIIHFRNGSLGDYKDGTEKLILGENLRFNVKKNKLDLFPKFLRKAVLSLRVDRFYGDNVKGKQKFNYSNRFYDLVFDRVNLILKNNIDIKIKCSNCLRENVSLTKKWFKCDDCKYAWEDRE